MRSAKFLLGILVSLLIAAPFSLSYGSVAFIETGRILAESPEARRGSEQAKVVEKANEAIRKFAQEKNIYFVFQEAVYASHRVNITSQVLQVMNGADIGSLDPIVASPRVGFVDPQRILREAGSQWGLESEDPSLVARVNALIQQVARSESFDLIFQEVVYASDKASITDRVVSEISGKGLTQVRVGTEFSAQNIKFIRTERVLKESPQAIVAQTLLEAEFKGRESDIRSNQKSSSHQRNMALEQFKRDLNRRRNEELTKVLSVANSVIRRVAELDQIDLVFQKAVYASDLVDITSQTIAALSKEAISPSGDLEIELASTSEEAKDTASQGLNSQRRIGMRR